MERLKQVERLGDGGREFRNESSGIAQTVCAETGCTGTKLTHSVTRQRIRTHCQQDWAGGSREN